MFKDKIYCVLKPGFSINFVRQKMCETKIEFKCLYCGMLYDPNEELECPECEEKTRIQNDLNFNQ